MLIVALILVQIVIFGALIFILKRVLTQNVSSATQHLDELNQEYLKKEQELTRQLKDTQKKSRETLAKAQEEATVMREKIIADAEKEKEAIVVEARSHSEEIIEQADKSRHSLIAEMQGKINKEAVIKACELIQFALPEEFRLDVHKRWVEELIEGGFAQLENIKIPDDAKEILATSAFALSDQQKKGLEKKLKEVIKRDIPLKEEVDPKVAAGIIIHIGSLELDGSLKNKIKQATKAADESGKE